MPGEVAFGRYVLLNKLAVGGMAEIFVAQATGEAGFRKACIVKRVLPHLALRPGFREMFLDEARVAARLNHPGIVQIFDLGREGEDFYLAMEYLAGEDVGAVLKRCSQLGRAVPVEVAARIVASAAEALHYAHELTGPDGRSMSIVHRDISPSNIIVTYQGTVKVLDFGIARAEQRLGETFAGAVKGKLAYMSPEQSRGEEVDRRADVWSLGVVLHELVTGQRLFSRDSLSLTQKALHHDPIPSPRSKRPELPEEIDELAMAALERDPAKRLPTADAVRGRLERFLADRTYVPSQLGQFVRELAGEERVRSRMQLGATHAPSGTAHPEPTPMLSAVIDSGSDQPTMIAPELSSVPSVAPPRRRRWLPAAGVLGLATVVGAVVGLRLFARDDTPPELPDIPPPVVEVAPPPPAPAPPPPVEVAKVEEPTHAAEEPVRTAEKRAEGSLSVASNVPGQAWLDGAKLGELPVSHARAAAGEHRLKIVNASLGLSRTVRVKVRGGANTDSRVEVPLGTLNVTVTPWADVFLDGYHLGQTPLAGRQVAAGPHELKLVSPTAEKSLKVDVPTSPTLVVREALP